jgi:demethylmenaquinone methyltransferase/2-methoxy-6-polyprenyl-1,4-benzoquinol methylase
MSSEAQRLGAHHIQNMFARIASRYDFLNHFLTAQQDKRWRRKAVALSEVQNHERVLDLCAGTGDLTLEFFKKTSRLCGMDFCRPMLLKAREKGPRIPFLAADALALPVKDASFDVVSVAFGIRNVVDLDRSLEEMLRVLKPGGRLVILELTLPPGKVFSRVFQFYFHRLVPRLARLFSEESAYRYLPESVARFPDAPELSKRMKARGFEKLSFEYLSFGVVALHRGYRP